jgi:C-3',4' desaturase CrtD
MFRSRSEASRLDSCDVAIVGGGMAGMATAARLQAAGLSTVVLEAHGQPGGCAGFYRRCGFSFDVGATTLVDFEPGGVGGELLAMMGLPSFEHEVQPAYVAWLPDRKVILHQDPAAWELERRRAFGDDSALRSFWSTLDRLADVFWRAARGGVKLPLRTPRDVLLAVRAVGVENLALARYLGWTMGDLLRAHGLREHRALVGLLSMLIEDTIHATIDEAPLINAALGVTLRHAGLTRARGGMRGFWRVFAERYRALGGALRVGAKVESITGARGDFRVRTRRGELRARQVVSALPVELTARIAQGEIARRLAPFVERDRARVGGAFILFLGVPEREVAGQVFTHHQLLESYERPLGDGNNMFISVSADGDEDSAPAGHRAVMISTHCAVEDWEALSDAEYAERKRSVSERLLGLARNVYASLGERAVVLEAGTPRTYERFTHRPRGAVGGVRLTLGNSNQRAVPHQVGVKGFWLAGDTTWPGLGTVACVLGSRIVARGVIEERERSHRRVRDARHAAVRPSVLSHAT